MLDRFAHHKLPEWFDSDSLYEVSDDRGVKVTCAIHPIHRDATICLFVNGDKVYAWRSQDLQDVRYIEEKNRTVVQFVVSDRDIVTLQVRPNILVIRETGPIA